MAYTYAGGLRVVGIEGAHLRLWKTWVGSWGAITNSWCFKIGQDCKASWSGVLDS